MNLRRDENGMNLEAQNMSARQMAMALASHYDVRANVVIPNCCTGITWEADLFVLRNSGWAEEVEIKVSKSDFRRDFVTKKQKHRELQAGKPSYHSPWHNEAPYDPLNPLHEAVNYQNVPGGSVNAFHDWGARDPLPLKRFWFAMPEELATAVLDEVPAHAGVYGLQRAGIGYLKVRVLQEAPLLKHRRQVTPDERMKLLRSCYYRYWDAMRRLEAGK